MLAVCPARSSHRDAPFALSALMLATGLVAR